MAYREKYIRGSLNLRYDAMKKALRMGGEPVEIPNYARSFLGQDSTAFTASVIS